MKHIFIIFVLIILTGCSSNVIKSISKPKSLDTYQGPDTRSDAEKLLGDWISITPNQDTCYRDSSGRVVFKGKVKNTTSFEIGSAVIRATVYDNLGNIVNTKSGLSDSDSLPIGASSTYTIYVEDPETEGTQCAVYITDALVR